MEDLYVVIVKKPNIIKSTNNNHNPFEFVVIGVSDGFVVFVKRDIDKLATAGRPLSAGDGKLEKLYNERLEKYMDMADVVIDNNGKLNASVEAAINAFEAK